MSAPDPSWCARINAHRHAEPAPPLPPPLRKVEIPTQHFCDICGVEMFDHNCKIVCPNCGYKRDCSDP